MRLLVISNLYPPDGYGGYERESLELVDALISRGHDTTVLTTSISTRSVARVQDPPHVRRLMHLANEYMPLIQEPSNREAELVQSRLVNAHNISVLCTTLSDVKPDAVLLCNMLGLGGLQLISTLNTLRVPWAWSLADRVPSILCDLGNFTDLIALLPIPRKAGRFLIEGTFLSLSQRLYQDIKDDGCDLKGALNVVPYWVDTSVPLPEKRTYYRGDGKLRLAFVGYVNENKGIDILLDAMKLLKSKGLHVRGGEQRLVLDVYGGGDVDRWHAAASEMQLEFVRFHGFKSTQQMHDIYESCDALVFPSMVREPFGNVTLEAAMRGCVPVINKMCGASEFLEHARVSIHVDRNAASFADAVEKVLSGAYDLEKMGKDAAFVARSNFKLTDAAARYEDALQSIAAPFHIKPDALHRAAQAALLTERVAFAQMERDFAAKRASITWMESEINLLKQALAEAKQGIEAYDQALTGEKNKLADCEEKLNTLQNSRIWKLRKILRR